LTFCHHILFEITHPMACFVSQSEAKAIQTASDGGVPWWLTDDSKSERVRRICLSLISKHRDLCREHADAVMSVLQLFPTEVLKCAYTMLPVGDVKPYEDELARLLNADNWPHREWAALVLSRTKPEDPGTQSRLRELAENDPVERVKNAAGHALTRQM
jgi:hypothetical protein